MKLPFSAILFLLISFSGFAQKQGKSPRFIQGFELDREQQVVVENVPRAEQKAEPSYPVTFAGSPIEHCSKLQFKYAMMTDREVEEVSNIRLYAFIDEWYSTPYRYGGCTRKGIDCSGFVMTLADAVYNTRLPRTARDQYQGTDRLDRAELVEGDFVFFNTRGGVSHVGVYLGNDFFVHSSTNSGVVISSLREEYYKRRFLGGGRNPQRKPALTSAYN
jgi:lipoprotein Spr